MRKGIEGKWTEYFMIRGICYYVGSHAYSLQIEYALEYFAFTLTL